MGVPHPQIQPPGWALSIYQAPPDYTTIVFQAHKPQREMGSPPDCAAKETGSPRVPCGGCESTVESPDILSARHLPVGCEGRARTSRELSSPPALFSAPQKGALSSRGSG